MKKLLWSLLLVTLPVVAYCADGDVFTVQTVEGVTLKMKVISEQAKTCQVGIGEIDEEGVIWGSSSDYFVTIFSCFIKQICSFLVHFIIFCMHLMFCNITFRDRPKRSKTNM